MLWVCMNQGGGSMCEPKWCDSEVLCLCVLPLEMFPCYTALVNCELSKHFSLPLQTGHTLPDSFLNSVFPQKRKWKSFSLYSNLCGPMHQSPWNCPGQNTGVGSLSLLQGIFLIQGSNIGLLHCTLILNQVSHKGNPRILEWVAYPFSRWTF